MEKVSIKRLYNNQNISIRKFIRQLDLQYAQNQVMGNQSHMPQFFNIAVVGPEGSGKTSLIKTINYAMNGSNTGRESLVYEMEPYLEGIRYQVKESKKVQVGGVSHYKSFQDKIPITFYEYRMAKNSKNTSVLQRYQKITENLFRGRGGSPTKNNSMSNCLKESFYPSNPGQANSSQINSRKISKIFKYNGNNRPQNNDNHNNTINYVIICCSMIDKIEAEQLFAIKCFVGQLEDRGIRYTVVGSKIDMILDTSQQNEQQEKLSYVDAWKEYVIKEFNLKRSNQRVYCMTNYLHFEKDLIENSEVLNFYALSLLQKIIKELKEYYQKTPKVKKMPKFLCFCS